MGDEYKILCKLVRRGMRRWWRKQGMLWILLLLALLACEVVFYVLIQKSMSTMTVHGFVNYMNIVVFLIPPLIGIIYVHLATTIRDQAFTLCSSTILIDDHLYNQYVLRLVLGHSWILLLAYWLYSIPSHIGSVVSFSSFRDIVVDDYLQIICSGLSSTLQCWFLLVVLGLVIVARFKHYNTIIVAYISCYFSWLYNGFQLLLITVGASPWGYGLYDDDPSLIIWHVIGSITAHSIFGYAIVRWLRTHTRRYELTLVLLLVLVTLWSLHTGFESGSANYYLNILLSFGNLYPLAIVSYTYFETGTLSLLIFGNRILIPASAGLSIISILNSLTMAALYYYGALYLLKLGSKPSLPQQSN